MRLNYLPTWQKLLLLALPSLLLAAVPTALHLRQLHRAATHEIKGAEGAGSLRPVIDAVRLAQQHRGLSHGVLSGNAALAAQRAAKKGEAAAALEAMGAAAPAGAAALASEAKILARSFSQLAAAVDAGSITPAESFRGHTELIARLLAALESWLDHYELSFEDDRANHFLVLAAYVHLPALTEAVGQARAHGTAMLTQRSPSAGDRLQAAALLDRAQEKLVGVRTALEKAAAYEPEVKARLSGALGRVGDETEGAIGLARRELVDAPQLEYGAAEYFALTTRAIDGQFQLLDEIARELSARLEMHAAADVRERDLMLLAVGVLLAAVIAFLAIVTRAITVPLSQAVAVAGRIASGRLDNEIRPDGRDEVARLLEALGDMQQRLVEVVGRIQRSGFAIRDAAQQAAAGNSDLSSRTEEQASTLEETAANMEELTTTVRANAESARAAIAVATEAADEARKGGELVARVVGTMGAIAEGSRRVREITETIDGIAFQTNLLSLNAAVEAARAGEHGRGFAVVAGEVRSLAQRCAEASRQIRGLIQQSGDRVEEGLREVDVAGEAVGRIVVSAQTAAQRVTEIAQASEQQRSGIEQVNQAVMQMDSVTQQNAALVEEAAANAMALERQAAELADAVAAFSIAAPGHASAASPQAPTTAPQRGLKLVRRDSMIRPAASLPSTIS